jgi:aminoglycoside phosphotransferase (APT) family kinase protein
MPANPMPAAEVAVSADLVRRLLADQHPDLARLPVTFLANGWDNAMFRVGDELAARVPRRELGAKILVHEQRWLPQLAPALPLQIPYPERMGLPALGYPWPWSIVPYIRGVPACDTDTLDPGPAAAALGGFLAALHVPAAADAPLNPFRGRPLRDRAENFDANMRLVSGQVDADAADRVWSAALAAPGHVGPGVWVHGDLHPANIVTRDGRISGVIDFGDITSGDPAVDLAVAWMLLPAAWHEAFRDAYAVGRGSDEALWTRAKGWALYLALVFLAYSADNPRLLGVGRRTVAAVLG